MITGLLLAAATAVFALSTYCVLAALTSIGRVTIAPATHDPTDTAHTGDPA